MTTPKRSVLITGCSDNSLGSALALAFQQAGLHVYATGRNPAKLTQVAQAGCQILTLDVQNAASIASCVAQIPRLDILVNNAGAGYSMPIADLSLNKARELFELNVWAPMAVTQAFLPLLRESKGLVANHTSVGSVLAIPFQSAYNASKAAMAMFSETMRMEFAAFDVRVVEIKTGGVTSNFVASQGQANGLLPEGSVYEPVKELAEAVLRGDWVSDKQTPAEDWDRGVVGDLIRKNPPLVVWRGYGAWGSQAASLLPYGSLDGIFKKTTGVDVIERELKKGS